MNPEPKQMNPEPKRKLSVKKDINDTMKPKENKYDAVAIELEKLRKSKAFRELGDMLYMD